VRFVRHRRGGWRSHGRNARSMGPGSILCHVCQWTSIRGSGMYEQYRPVRIVADRCRPNAGFAWATFRIAARMARVTLSRARSTWEAARRSRPPSPTARASSATRKSISSRPCCWQPPFRRTKRSRGRQGTHRGEVGVGDRDGQGRQGQAHVAVLLWAIAVTPVPSRRSTGRDRWPGRNVTRWEKTTGSPSGLRSTATG
jgi:hypothetical protein